MQHLFAHAQTLLSRRKGLDELLLWRLLACHGLTDARAARLAQDVTDKGSALHVMLFLENLIRALLISNGLRGRNYQRALLVYHYPMGEM
jgi:hypothetical protein